MDCFLAETSSGPVVLMFRRAVGSAAVDCVITPFDADGWCRMDADWRQDEGVCHISAVGGTEQERKGSLAEAVADVARIPLAEAERISSDARAAWEDGGNVETEQTERRSWWRRLLS